MNHIIIIIQTYMNFCIKDKNRISVSLFSNQGCKLSAKIYKKETVALFALFQIICVLQIGLLLRDILEVQGVPLSWDDCDSNGFLQMSNTDALTTDPDL